jgi:hypothetical protein
MRNRRPTCPTVPWPMAGEWQPPVEVDSEPLPPPHEHHTERSRAVTVAIQTIEGGADGEA